MKMGKPVGLVACVVQPERRCDLLLANDRGLPYKDIDFSTAYGEESADDEREPARYLIRDCDASYGYQFRRRIQSLRIQEVITAPRSPWQNAFAERLIGSIRRECLDHVVVLNERHLRRLLKSYLKVLSRFPDALGFREERS